jgi:hypothetical protein
MASKFGKNVLGPLGALIKSLFSEWHNSLKDQRGKTSAPRVTAFLMSGLIILFVIMFYAYNKIIPDNYLSAVVNILMVTLGYAKSESWSWPKINKGNTTLGGTTGVMPPPPDNDDDSTPSPDQPFVVPSDGARK